MAPGGEIGDPPGGGGGGQRGGEHNEWVDHVEEQAVRPQVSAQGITAIVPTTTGPGHGFHPVRHRRCDGGRPGDRYLQ